MSSVSSNHTGTYKCVSMNSPFTFPSQESVNVFVLRKFAVFSCFSENIVFYYDTSMASRGNKLMAIIQLLYTWIRYFENNIYQFTSIGYL